MRSMTGYGTKEYSDQKIRITVDLKAYNNKYLDVSLNMPPWLGSLEGKIRDIIKSKGINRGRIELNIKVNELTENIKIDIDQAVIKEVVNGLQSVMDKASIDSKIELSDIMSFDGVVKTHKTRDLNQVYNLIKPVIDTVLQQFIIAKNREGEDLKVDIYSALDLIEKEIKTLKGFVPKIEEKIKNNFKNRFLEVLGNEVDENRILAEVGVLLVKYDINEELVRLKSHISNFRESSKVIPCGKKLDFICQEMNREINTIGSKSPIIEISQIVVNMKNNLEQIREQARNVE